MDLFIKLQFSREKNNTTQNQITTKIIISNN